VHTLDIVWRPHLGPQQAQAHLHQTMLEVHEDYVIPSAGNIMVKRDRPTHAGVRVE
jgi:hypothetical protein